MSGLASVTDAQRQGLVFLKPDHISSFHEISGGTEITLTVLSFAVVVAAACNNHQGTGKHLRRAAQEACSRLLT